MAATLDLRWASQAGSAVGSLGLRYANLSGTPILSCVRRDLGEGTYPLGQYNGQFVADTYTLNFTTGPHVTVIADLGSKNPWHNATPVDIVTDGVTVHSNLIGGVDLVFSAGTVNGNQGVVTVGAYLSAGGIDTEALNFGVTKNDGVRDTFRAAVVNTGTDTAADVRLSVLPGGYYSGTDAASIICRLGPHSEDTRAKMAQVASYAITYDTWTNAGAYYTANVNVGGQLCIATAKFDGETVYEWGSANGYVDADDRLKGWQVVFAKITATPVGKTTTFVSAQGWAWAEVAADVGGAALSFSSGPVLLGDIAPSATVYVWCAVTIPEGTAKGAIKLWTPRLRFMGI
jgi:hypothetical protein